MPNEFLYPMTGAGSAQDLGQEPPSGNAGDGRVVRHASLSTWPPGPGQSSNTLPPATTVWPGSGSAAVTDVNVQHYLEVAVMPSFGAPTSNAPPAAPNVLGASLHTQVSAAIEHNMSVIQRFPLMKAFVETIRNNNDPVFMPMLHDVLLSDPGLGQQRIEQYGAAPERMIVDWLLTRPAVRNLVSTISQELLKAFKSEPEQRYKQVINPALRPRSNTTTPLTPDGIANELVVDERSTINKQARSVVKRLLTGATFYDHQHKDLSAWAAHLGNKLFETHLLNDVCAHLGHTLSEECRRAGNDHTTGSQSGMPTYSRTQVITTQGHNLQYRMNQPLPPLPPLPPASGQQQSPSMTQPQSSSLQVTSAAPLTLTRRESRRAGPPPPCENTLSFDARLAQSPKTQKLVNGLRTNSDSFCVNLQGLDPWLQSLPPDQLDAVLKASEANHPDALFMEWLSDVPAIDDIVKSKADDGVKSLRAHASGTYERFIHPPARESTVSSDAIDIDALVADYAPSHKELARGVRTVVKSYFDGVYRNDIPDTNAWLESMATSLCRRYVADDVKREMKDLLLAQYHAAHPSGSAYARTDTPRDLLTNRPLDQS